jgi:hypothetical protein
MVSAALLEGDEDQPPNNEMKRTKPAQVRMARSSPLISVLGAVEYPTRRRI